MSTERLMSWAVWLGGAGHFLLLGASFQVPRRLRWRSDLAKLLPLNRKLLWAYGGYIVGTYLAFGVMRSGGLLRGGPCARRTGSSCNALETNALPPGIPSSTARLVDNAGRSSPGGVHVFQAQRMLIAGRQPWSFLW